jgi:hypothetical protein
VQRTDALLRGERALFEALVRGARRAVSAGWSDEEAIARIELRAHRSFMADLEVNADTFERWRVEAVRAAVSEERDRRGGVR